VFSARRRWGLLLAILAAACAGSPEPTATLLPTAAQMVSPTPALAATATATAPLSEPTPNATALIDSVVTHSAPQTLATLDSPDGQWRVEALRSDCTPIGGDQLAYEQLLLHTTGTGEARIVADQLLYCGGLGAFGLEPLYWSSDSRYLYYTPAREGQPDGGCVPWYRPIVRLDIRSGDREEVAEGTPSPDGTRTASALGQEWAIWGRDEPEILRFPAAVPGKFVGTLAWSPDGQSLAYLLRESFCPPDTDPSFLVRLDLPGGQQAVLLDAEAPPVFVNVSWEAAGELRLSDTDGQVWVYDLAAKTLTRAPA
jgi:WD40 repeat protein